MVKKGDTLIEVTLAVGIFSMVAIAIVAVMSGGISGAQTALETTLTRNEIDAQAEALRFINTSYIGEKNSASETYKTIWGEIKKRAITNPSDNENILQFIPTNCQDLYSNEGEVSNHGFIIDYKNLSDPNKAVISANDPSKKNSFKATSTYPRLVYTGSSKSLDDDNNSNFSSAEGIYVIAVKDEKTTNMVSSGGAASAFYDFYIRTCWYGTDAEEPSTISTVIRLYDPDVIK